jgi:hypothetical protein
MIEARETCLPFQPLLLRLFRRWDRIRLERSCQVDVGPRHAEGSTRGWMKREEEVIVEARDRKAIAQVLAMDHFACGCSA